jgi:tetratricopeptide (TPR) repeat protein
MLHLIELEPDDHHNYRILGKMRVESGQQRLAIDALTRSLEISPEALTYAHRGRAHWELGERERALADFEEAVARRPEEPEYYLGQAKALASLDRVEEALANASRAIELSPDHAFAHIMRAVYRAHVEGDEAYAAVRADLDRAVALEPNNVAYRRQRGEYLMDFHKCAAALVDFERAIALAPDTAFLYYGRGYCKSRLVDEIGDIEGDYLEEDEDTRPRCLSAIADLEKAIALGLRDEDLYSELWNAYCQMQDEPMQEQALDRGCAAVPDSALLFYFRHGHRRAKGDLEGADADKAKASENGWSWRDD